MHRPFDNALFLLLRFFMLSMSFTPQAALGNPRFSHSFLHGKTDVFPTPFFCKWFLRKLLGVNKCALLFRFFMLSMSFTPFAVLLELDFARDKLAVLAGPVVGAVALAACESEELIL